MFVAIAIFPTFCSLPKNQDIATLFCNKNGSSQLSFSLCNKYLNNYDNRRQKKENIILEPEGM
jgi:hypothetical protein